MYNYVMCKENIILWREMLYRLQSNVVMASGHFPPFFGVHMKSSSIANGGGPHKTGAQPPTPIPPPPTHTQ